MSRLLIKVTQKCILKGELCEPSHCPISLAIKECGYRDVGVCNSHIRIGDTTYPITRNASRFVSKFDCGKCVRPFNFYLDLNKGECHE